LVLTLLLLCSGIQRQAASRAGQGRDTQDKEDTVDEWDEGDTEDIEDTEDQLATEQEMESYDDEAASGYINQDDIVLLNIE
jgi:hypothetical protein